MSIHDAIDDLEPVYVELCCLCHREMTLDDCWHPRGTIEVWMGKWICERFMVCTVCRDKTTVCDGGEA